MISRSIQHIAACLAVFFITAAHVQACTILLPTSEPVAIDKPPFGTADSFGTGGFAVTRGGKFIDAPIYYFDLGSSTASVSNAVLSLEAIDLFGNTNIQTSVFADDGISQLTDYEFFPASIDTFTYLATGVRTIDVTAAVNAILPGQFLGFQLQSTLNPNLPTNDFEGVQFGRVSLELMTGSPAVPEPTSLAIFGFGALGMAGIRRRKRR